MGNEMKVYVMRIIERNMTILIPVDKSIDIGLRPVMKDTEVDEVFDVLKERSRVSDGQTWNRRFRWPSPIGNWIPKNGAASTKSSLC